MEVKTMGTKTLAQTADCRPPAEWRDVVEGWPLWRQTRLHRIRKGI